MAKVNNTDYSQKRGKLNKKDNVIHRVRNGKEHTYSILHPYQGPASKAQKKHRELFGKVNAQVNRIMNDPAQKEEWTARKEAFNKTVVDSPDLTLRKYTTTRKYVFDKIKEQILQEGELKPHKPLAGRSLPKGATLSIKIFDQLSAAELYEILKARFEVFVMEQNIHYLDEDSIDYISTHLFVSQNGRVIAYARLFPEAQKGVLRLGRMLTLVRGQGLGKFILRYAVAEAKKRGAEVLRLHAQLQTVNFYKRRRFRAVGEVFMEAEIPHVCMERVL